MSEALFSESSGYYRKKNPIGKSCDFITAPEISQVFGEILAAYFLQISATKKSKIAFVEMGAGKGTLFYDILFSIKKLAEKNIPQAVDFLERASFHIIEIGEVLREVQQKNLTNFPVSWHKNFADFLSHILVGQKDSEGTPSCDGVTSGGFEVTSGGFEAANSHLSPRRMTGSDCEIFFLSNELFDCFPIDQFVFTESGWRERIVVGKSFSLAPFDKKIHDLIEAEVSFLAPFGGVFEISFEARNFMKELCKALKKQGGIAINIDYGYYKNEFVNTLQAVKNHKKCDVLENVGEADLTALVDFLALEKIVKNCGLNSSLVSQRNFLKTLGIEERRKVLLAKNPTKTEEINLSVDRLIASNQMGELFKCLIVF